MIDTEHREEALFEAALKLPADQRAVYLDQACAGDTDLRRRVEALLGAFDRAGGFMRAPAISLASVRKESDGAMRPSLLTEKAGDRIGRYKLLEQIGEGGCGVVYVAEQEEPVHRQVALKVIKLGMDTKQVIARFEAERQALALMDHPNIAKIHDAGVTETGRPYFVMEFVRGIKITDYCDQNHVSPHERLDLFIQVCRAIQHAHQKGVIHRDIKPSNILVTQHDGVPMPKVIDFGIAKAALGRLTDQTVYTAFEQFIGTPAYMSPEQAELSGQDIDTRSDIYSLGVLLYELLSGKTPFDAKELLAAGLDEMRRTIREVEPVKPSTRLTQELQRLESARASRKSGSARAPRAESDASSDSRSSNQKSFEESQSQEVFVGATKTARGARALPKSALRTAHSAIPSDLDWIVMKCLEKDRTRRYETANGLAADLSRHLSNEPVVARPPSRLYRFQKTVQRNKLAFAAGALVFVSLVICLGVSIWMYRKQKLAYAELLISGRMQEQYGRRIPFEAAVVALKAGRTNSYRQICHEYLDRAVPRREFESADMAAKASLLLPMADDDFTRACELADFAATEPAGNFHARFVLLVKSMAEYRRGRFESAISWTQRTTSFEGVSLRHAAAALFIEASAHCWLRQYDAARVAFEKGEALIKPPNDVVTGAFGDTWFDLSIAQFLRAEAVGLLEGQAKQAATRKAESR